MRFLWPAAMLTSTDIIMGDGIIAKKTARGIWIDFGPGGELLWVPCIYVCLHYFRQCFTTCILVKLCIGGTFYTFRMLYEY